MIPSMTGAARVEMTQDKPEFIVFTVYINTIHRVPADLFFGNGIEFFPL